METSRDYESPVCESGSQFSAFGFISFLMIGVNLVVNVINTVNNNNNNQNKFEKRSLRVHSDGLLDFSTIGPGLEPRGGKEEELDKIIGSVISENQGTHLHREKRTIF